MRYVFTLWLPVTIVLAIAYLAGFLRWHTPIIAFVSAVITQFVYEFYFKEKDFPELSRDADQPPCLKLLRHLQYNRLTPAGYIQHLSNGASIIYRPNGVIEYRVAPARIVSIEEMQDAIQGMRHLLQRNDAILLPDCNPSPERFLQQGYISEAVAAGEIKSTGKSVSVDDVIAKIDEHLDDNNSNS